MRICVVGAGRMGLPVARRLLQAGYDVNVADLCPRPTAAAGPQPSLWTEDASRAASNCDVAISLLPTPDALVACAEQAMPALPPGSTWIDMGSNGPAMSRTLAQLAVPAGVHLVDAPVGGGPAQAERGALALYVGGERAAVDDQRPLLRVLADESRIHHLGGPGAGYAGKLMINLLWFGQVIASTEALLVAKGFGVDPAALHAALTTSAVGGAFVDNALTALLSGDYLTSFGLRGCVDELVAACEMARTTETPFALSTLVTDIYRRALDEFGAVDGELMAAALLEKQAGALLRW